MKVFLTFLCCWLMVASCVFAQDESLCIDNENATISFSVFSSKTQKEFNKKFKKYCKKHLIRSRPYHYFNYLTFTAQSIDFKDEMVKLSAERIKNVIADTNPNTTGGDGVGQDNNSAPQNEDNTNIDAVLETPLVNVDAVHNPETAVITLEQGSLVEVDETHNLLEPKEGKYQGETFDLSLSEIPKEKILKIDKI